MRMKLGLAMCALVSSGMMVVNAGCSSGSDPAVEQSSAANPDKVGAAGKTAQAGGGQPNSTKPTD